MSKLSKTFAFLSIFIPVLLIIVGIVLASLAIKKLITSSETLECFCPSCPETNFAEKGAASLGLIKVDIQGAVKKPGIYQLEIGQRLADLLSLAEGFTKEADASYIAKTLNLSTELKDQDKIYIPFLEENQNQDSQGSSSDIETSSQSESGLISINQADAKQLQTLTGIGEAKAQAIIDSRPYSNLEELVSKKVISENLFNSLKVQLTL